MSKYKVIPVVMLMLAMTLMAGCSTKTTEQKESTKEEKSMTTMERKEYPEFDASKYVDVSDGKYKGLQVDVQLQDIKDVTDAQVETSAIANLPKQTVKEAAKDGDTVTLDFVGKIDGKPFDGGTASDYEVELGSNALIEGFEESLVGLKTGDKKDVSVKFPDDYQQDDLKGKDAVFSVNIKKVERDGELTDDYVKANTEYKTVKEYLESIRTRITSSIEKGNTTAVTQAVSDKLVEQYKDVKIPDDLVNWLMDNSTIAYEEAAKYYDVTADDYVSRYTNGEYKTLKDLQESWKTTAEDNLKIEVILRAIAQKEKLSVSKNHYKDLIDGYVKDYNCKSQDEFEQYFKRSNAEATMLANDVLDFVRKEAKVNNTTEKK